MPNFLIDRYLLSQGLTAPFLFWANAIGYAPLADDFDVPVAGHSFSTTGSVLQKGADANGDPGKTFTVDFSWQEATAKVLSGVSSKEPRSTSPTPLSSTWISAGSSRAATPGFISRHWALVDRAVWDLAQSALIGRDAAAGGFRGNPQARRQAPLTRRAAVPDRPPRRARLQGVQPGMGRSREPERKTIASGLSDILTNSEGMKPYLALDGKYAVGKRFNECQLK